MRVWQQKETVSVFAPLAWSPPVSATSPASALLLCAQPINCTMKQDKWELPARQRLMSFEPICTHSINKGGDQKAWSISIDSVVQSDSVPALRCVICGLRKPLSVAISLWLEVYDEEALNLFHFFPPSNELKQWATAPTIVTSVLQKGPDGLHVNYNKEPGVLINDSPQSSFVAQKKSEHLMAFCIHMYLETDVKTAKKEHEFDCKQARRLKWLSGETNHFYAFVYTDENLKYRFVCVWVTWVCSQRTKKKC